LKISDIRKIKIEHEGKSLDLLSEDDHFLRRFGSLEMLKITGGEESEFVLRKEADDLIFPISGQVSITVKDRRDASPSQGAQEKIELGPESGFGLLIPFNLAYSISSDGAASLIRLSTHKFSSKRGDQTISIKDFESYHA